jgi:hypothetical protein
MSEITLSPSQVNPETLREIFAAKPEPDAYEQITNGLLPVLDHLEARLHGGHAEAAITADLVTKWGPEAQWRRADDPERQDDRRAAEARYTQAAGEDVYKVDHLAYRHQHTIAGLEQAMDPPDAVAVWTQRTTTAPGANEQLLLTIQDELRQARFERELATAAPSQCLDRYARALTDPTEQANASLIRYVEGRHRQGWRGAASGDLDEAMAAQDLQNAILAARAARVPATAIAARALVARAEAAVATATGIWKFRSQIPAGWRMP